MASFKGYPSGDRCTLKRDGVNGEIPEMAKFIFVTGGVVSSLGKGITAASIGLLLKSRGLRVIHQKFDPYLNVDPHYESLSAWRGICYR